MTTTDLNIDLLRKLCELPGIPGREEAVREFVREEMAPLVDEINVDALGNLIGVRRGQGGPRVMLAAHMDEIGFIVKHIDDKGFLRLQRTGGIFVVLEALRALDGPTTAEIIAVATVQEEVGTRGASTAAFAYEPDVALALDDSPADDYAGAPEESAGLRLGPGVGIKAMDMGTIPNYRLNLHLKRLARDNGIPFQMEILVRGGTDAGAMQRARSGAPTSALSIPVRYAHTVNETCSPTDVQATIDLLKLFLEHTHEGDYRKR